ncbi:cytochrome c oxidase subunit 3 family protein [Desulfobacterota bacterium AH_259_B03_O07]|nr:cytochrome c oxidase subunit 3 family protein [Desulfobacterota bacterium AH_259_B03_O07]
MEEIGIEHGHVHHIDPAVGYESSKLGMWLFLATELLLFGGLFAVYTIFRAKYPVLFEEQHHELNKTLGAANTVILIFSSLTMALGVASIQKGKRNLLSILLAITIICGVMFGINKYFEYTAKFEHHIYPSTSIFFALYYMMTGLHMLHVLVGVIILAVLLVLNIRGKFTEKYNAPIEIGGLYWHLVDLIWIYLFPLLYLIA